MGSNTSGWMEDGLGSMVVLLTERVCCPSVKLIEPIIIAHPTMNLKLPLMVGPILIVGSSNLSGVRFFLIKVLIDVRPCSDPFGDKDWQ